MVRYLIPLALFIVLLGFFLVGLGKDPNLLPSALLDKPAPAFTLSNLHSPEKSLSTIDMKGKVWVLNVWASWCAACRTEHPLFMDIAREGGVNLYGLNYKDKREDAMTWLRQLGNPYAASLSDLSGDVGIDYGVYGVPETFIIDAQGIVRMKHVGPVSRADWRDKLLPMIKRLEG